MLQKNEFVATSALRLYVTTNLIILMRLCNTFDALRESKAAIRLLIPP